MSSLRAARGVERLAESMFAQLQAHRLRSYASESLSFCDSLLEAHFVLPFGCNSEIVKLAMRHLKFICEQLDNELQQVVNFYSILLAKN